MTETKSTARNPNHDDASSLKRTKTCENGDVATWSDLNHDLLLLVMMQLGVIDFIAFSGVCKSWRSFSLTNRNAYMASRTPMSISISPEKAYYLEDFEGRKFKTILPHSGGRNCVGLTCGYLILFGEKTHDFWLVNPITRHELHFPDVTFDVYHDHGILRAILVFSPSTSEWVFVISNKYSSKIWFSVAGEGAWTYISSPFCIHDLHAFKGKIYTLHYEYHSSQGSCLGEVILSPEPKLVLLETKDYPKRTLMLTQFAKSGENLYVMDPPPDNPYKFHELDFGEMRWVSSEKTIEEYPLFFSDDSKHNSFVIQESWVDPRSQYERYALTNKRGKGRFFYAKMWYFFHDCLHLNLLNE